MAYLTHQNLLEMGFKSPGKDVKISDKACIYNADQIEVGDYSRIDDSRVVSGKVVIGRYNHITPICLVAGGIPSVFFADFCTLAYGVKIFSQSDDYSGETPTNSLLPGKYKNEFFGAVYADRHSIIGAGATIFPCVIIAEGCAVGAMALLLKSTQP